MEELYLRIEMYECPQGTEVEICLQIIMKIPMVFLLIVSEAKDEA